MGPLRSRDGPFSLRHRTARWRADGGEAARLDDGVSHAQWRSSRAVLAANIRFRAFALEGQAPLRSTTQLGSWEMQALIPRMIEGEVVRQRVRDGLDTSRSAVQARYRTY